MWMENGEGEIACSARESSAEEEEDCEQACGHLPQILRSTKMSFSLYRNVTTRSFLLDPAERRSWVLSPAVSCRRE